MADPVQTQPAAPATPAPTQPATPSPAPAQEGDPFAKMDTAVKAPRVKVEAKAEPKKETPKEPSKVAAPTPEKPKAEPEAPKEPKELRAELDRIKGELSSKANKIAVLENAIKDHESRGRDTSLLAEKLQKAEKEQAELRAQLRAQKFEASDQFKASHEEPFREAVAVAEAEIPQLDVLNEEGAPVRKATWRDFQAMYRMERADAKATAKRLFGEDATQVMSHYDALHRMETQMNVALDRERKNWEQSAKDEETKQAQQREQWQSSLAKVDKELAERNPEWFGEDPNDPEGNELLKEGYAIVDVQPKTFQEAVLLRSHIRHRAAAFGRMAKRAANLAAENADLKAEIAAMKDGEPGKVKRPGESAKAPAEKDWRQEIREAASAA